LNPTEKKIKQCSASLVRFEFRGESNTLEVGSRLYCIFYQPNAFEKNMLSLTHCADATESFHQRILSTGNFLYEHCAEYTTGYCGLSRFDVSDENIR